MKRRRCADEDGAGAVGSRRMRRSSALRDAFGDATETTQLLVTTHSTDLLDSKDVDAGWIRVVVSEHGATRIGPLSAATRSVVDDHLSTAGALLRSSPLYPALGSSTPAGSSLFDE